MIHNESSLAPYDAVLLVSFGGPERDEDVVPFLRNVTVGKDIPDERLKVVGEHYFGFGGKSPINDQNKALMQALERELAERRISIPIHWGNRNWEPYLPDALEGLRDEGAQRVVCIVTSAYSSYSGCRQYRENLHDAAQAVPGSPHLDRVRHYFNLPGFISAMAQGVRDTLVGMPAHTRLAFVTHSIPKTMNESSGPTGGAYVEQHLDAMRAILSQVGDYQADLVFCSRSGPPGMAWLEPDISDHLRDLADAGTTHVVMIPLGFISDHMEVIYDLDTEAMSSAATLGLTARRAPTAGTHPDFVAGLVDLLLERAAMARGETLDQPTVGSLGPCPSVCTQTCCPNPRVQRPAIWETS